MARVGRLTTNKWKVDVEFRGGAAQCIRLIWIPCHFGGRRAVAQMHEVQRTGTGASALGFRRGLCLPSHH